jgi:hypothetical protein
MCTLTYLPSDGGYAMVSSRDELRARGPMAPPVHDRALGAVYPLDVRSQGTWLLTATAGFTVNLLNGGYERHSPDGPYRHSRGLVPLLFARSGGIDPFLATFDPEGIEPFTLVVVTHDRRSVTELVWTGQRLDRNACEPDVPRIWSSSTLYDPAARAQREAWFRELIRSGGHGAPIDTLLDFHRNGGRGFATEDRTIRMRRPNGPETVALVGVVHDRAEWSLRYHDLVRTEERIIRLIGS